MPIRSHLVKLYMKQFLFTKFKVRSVLDRITEVNKILPDIDKILSTCHILIFIHMFFEFIIFLMGKD